MPLSVHIQKAHARFDKLHDKNQPGAVAAEFFTILDITATAGDVYIPVSIASGKKPTGFIYQIEGTAEGVISTTNISCDGDGIAQVTLGTIRYCKIPAGKTGVFRILIEIRGETGEEYVILINRINYKHDPTDARYEKLVTNISTKKLRTS